MRPRHFVLAVCFGLAGCAPASLRPAVLLPTVTPAAETQAPLPTFPRVAPSATPRPNADPVASATALAATQAVLAARNTERAIGTATAGAEQYARQEAAWATAIATQTGSDVVDALPSPNNAFRVETVRSPCVGVQAQEGMQDALAPARSESLVLVNADNNQRTLIESVVFFCEGLGAAGLAPVRWSSDGRFLYYTTAARGSPDGAPCLWSRPFVRYDLVTRARDERTEGTSAPDGNTIASATGAHITLWSWDAEATTTVDLRAPVVETTRLAWSADGAQLAVLSFGHTGCWGDQAPWLTVIDRARGAIVTQWDLDAVDWAEAPLARTPWWNATLAWDGADTLRLSQIEGLDDAVYTVVARVSTGGVEITSP